MAGPPAPPPPPPPPFDAPPPPPHAHIPVAKGGATLSELLAKRVKRSAADIEEGNEPVWSVAASQYLQQKSKTGFAGLSNQGATCYLNSLVQTLFMTPELRSALYAWTYNPELDGAEELCIPLHLQRLFLRLQMGASAIVETKDLTTSFGWSGSQALQQHDVQELLRKLFEALDVCLTRGATAIRSTASASQEGASSKQKEFKVEESHHDEQEEDPELLAALAASRADFEAKEASTASKASLKDGDSNEVGNRTANIVNELYSGEILDYIRCMECSFARERHDPFFDIPIVTRDTESIEQGLEKYLTPEILSEGNQWNCERCGTKVDAFKGLQFSRLPYFLTLQLNRFDYDYQTWRRIKLNNKVSFPQTLDMTKFFTPSDSASSAASTNQDEKDIKGKKEDSEQQYELFSVMIHSGGAEGGHYYAFVKSFETGKWYKFNDASVSEISEDDICTVFGGAPPKNTPAGTTSNSTASIPAPPSIPAAPKPPSSDSNSSKKSISANSDSTNTSGAGTETKSIPKPPPMGSSYSTNAYMLLYRLIDPSRNKKAVNKDEISKTLMDWISQENSEFERLRAEHQKRLDNVAITVYYDKKLQTVTDADDGLDPTSKTPKTANPCPSPIDNMNTFTVNVDKHETLGTALKAVYDAGISRSLQLLSTKCIRLRPFTPQTGTLAPAWLPRAYEESTLETLNFGHQKNVYIEVKSSDSEEWVDEEVFYTLGVIKFNGKDGFEPAVSIKVPWRSTLADLKKIIMDSTDEEISKHESIDELAKRYEKVETETVPNSSQSKDDETSVVNNTDNVLMRVFVVDSSANCRELKEESGVLNETHRLADGQCVHIEYMPAITTSPSSEIESKDSKVQYKSLVAARFEEERHKIQLFYNSFDAQSFEHSILIDSRRTLKELKAEIATAMGTAPTEFKMCRNLLSKEFNNLELSIAAANLCEGSAVCLVRGRPLGVNELKLKVSVFKSSVDDEESFTTPWTVSIDEACTVLELRDKIAESKELREALVSIGKLDSVDSEVASPSAHCLRLREKRATRCSSVLFDGDTMKEAMDNNLSDGDEVVVQILDAPDTLKRSDLILVFRRWVPKLRELEPNSFELVVPRNASMGETRKLLAEHLLSISPNDAITLQHLVVSKPFMFMIKKKDASALSGLNWEMADDVQLTQSPWYLGDGSLLLFKDMSDPEHGNAESSAIGSEGSHRPQARAEQGIKIHTIYDEKPAVKEEATKDSSTTTGNSETGDSTQPETKESN